jgi:energy-coupling factor transporter ATP-binding protein EcfA2
MQKITLRPFGPIRDVEINVNDFMIFIGPQASGKSTICKAIYFFKSLKDDFNRYLLDAIEKRDFRDPLASYAKLITAKFRDFWGRSTFVPGIQLEYDYGNSVQVRIDVKGGYVEPSFNFKFRTKFMAIVERTESLAELFKEKTPSFKSSSEMLALRAEKKSALREVGVLTDDLFNEHRDLLFVPAGRSLLATFFDQLQEITPRRLDLLMRTFIDRIIDIRPLFSESLSVLVQNRRKITVGEILFDDLEKAERIITNIIKGTFQYDVDGGKLFYDSASFTKLNDASSGQQEAIWILLLIYLIILENQEVFSVIEEPEAHLYPEAQQEMVRLMALLANVRKNQVVVTTHSPYILSAMNNLLYAHRLGQAKPQETGKVIDRRLWLDPKRLGAYFVSDGKVEDILDYDTGLIKAEKIDSASRQINRVYDSLFDLDDE